MMKFHVIAYGEERMRDFGIPGYRGENRTGYFHAIDDSHDGWNGRDTQLWSFEDVGAAVAMAKYMAGLYPNVQYAVTKIEEVYVSKPGAVVGSKLTEKGMLPI